MGKERGRAKGGRGSRVRMPMSGNRGMEGAVGVKGGRRRRGRRGERGWNRGKGGKFLNGNTDMLGLSLGMSRRSWEAMDERAISLQTLYVRGRRMAAWRQHALATATTRTLSRARNTVSAWNARNREIAKSQQALDETRHRETERFSTGRQQRTENESPNYGRASEDR